MTIWAPDLSDSVGPRYLAISSAISDDIDKGLLSAGARLPTQRDLAHRLGVTVGTISRAYADAERRGLISGEVGRGTFVRSPADGPDEDFQPLDEESALIELSMNYPMSAPREAALRETMAALAQRNDIAALFGYHPPGGSMAHRAIGAEWIAGRGVSAQADDVVVTSGAQNGMAVVFAAITEPGDLVLTDALAYPGMKALAAALHVRLGGLEMDDEGLRPDAFAAACRAERPKALYTVPTIQNPTASVMSIGRRRAIAEIARRYDVALVEDDIYGFMLESAPPPLATFAPELAYYIASVSKYMAPALRIAFVRAPDGMIGQVISAIRATIWVAPPVMAEIAVSWIRDGTAEKIAAAIRQEARARQNLARRVLSGRDYTAQPSGLHLWLRLPEPWRARDFVAQARRRGVAVSPAEAFAVGRAPAPHAVRVCLGAPRARARVEAGLEILADIMAGQPEPADSVV